MNIALLKDWMGRIPEKFRYEDGTGFEETVFDMNMVETQFDVLDLFIYIYNYGTKKFRGMLEYPDLLEFFNLPFEWKELEKLSQVGS